jgi:hypothetical protein
VVLSSYLVECFTGHPDGLIVANMALCRIGETGAMQLVPFSGLYQRSGEIMVKTTPYADALFKEIQLGEARLKAAGVKVLAPPVNPTNLPAAALQRTRFAHR